MNELLVAVSVILFPGLTATVIADKITVHTRRWDSFKYTIYSFIFGVSCYLPVQLLSWVNGYFPTWFRLLPFTGNLDVWSTVTLGQANTRLSEVFVATLVSVPVAFLGSYVVKQKLLYKLAKIMNVSQKYGDENLYSFFLNANEIDWVYIRDFERGLTYQGRVVSFSENERIHEIVLSEVTVFAYADSTELYSVPNVYICREMGRLVIERVPDEILEIVNGKETPE